MKARILIEKSPETGHLYARSSDIQGFHAHGADLEALSRSVADVIRLIYARRETSIGDVELNFSPDALNWSEGEVTIHATFDDRKVAAA